MDTLTIVLGIAGPLLGVLAGGWVATAPHAQQQEMLIPLLDADGTAM